MDKKLDQHRIKEMLEAVINVAGGDFSAQLELSDKNDDIDSLAMAINMMIDDLKTNTIELEYAENRIEEISKIIQAVAKGDYSVLCELSNKNDIFDALGIGVNMMIDDIITGTGELIKSINEYEALNEEYKTQNEELFKAKAKAEKANQAKSKFLSSMSHELRTPLNSILGYNQILKKGKNITKEQKDQIDTVLRSGQHLLDLINDILDISKIEAGKQVLIPIDFNLPDLLNDVFNINKINAEKKGLYFHYNTITHIPKIVRGDYRKVKQILLNILSNAVKYTDNGGIDFSVATKKGNGNIIILKITDTGIGIEKEKMKVIFEPFNQLGKIYNIGTGLGLPITKSLVELMKGKLSVSSTPGKGSCFTVELPFEIISHTNRKELRKTIQLPGKKQQKEKKIPPVDILDKILNETKRGNYKKLEQIIHEIRKEDKDFAIFCDKLNSLAKKYDEDSIIKYINILK